MRSLGTETSKRRPTRHAYRHNLLRSVHTLYRPTAIHAWGNLISALNHRISMTKDIEKCASTKQILRVTTLPAKYTKSPFGLAPKQGGTWRRIHHLSSPTGHSVNDNIPLAWGTLRFKRFDDAIAAVLACGHGSVFIKLHLPDSFGHHAVRPDECWLLRFSRMGTWWCDQFLQFGNRSLPAIFYVFASALEWILHSQQGLEHKVHNRDDFLVIFPCSAPSDALDRYKRDFSQICSELGFRVKGEQNEEGHCIRFLGIEIDTAAMEARLLHIKHEKATALVNSTLALHLVTHRSLETTVGCLSVASKVLPAIAPFLCQLYNDMTAISQTDQMGVWSDITKDLFWWHTLLTQCNGIRLLPHPRRICELWIGASEQNGIGGYFL